MKDRGMKKWAPYASLIEQKGSLKSMQHQRNKLAKPLLSDDQAQTINAVLLNAKHKLCQLKYFDDGDIIDTITTIKNIDFVFKTIHFDDKVIPIKDLIVIDLI